MVKYCGRMTQHGGVVWFDEPFDRILNEYFNTGDICVYDSTLKLAHPGGRTTDLNIEAPVDMDIVRRLKETCKTIVLRGSNYIHEEMQWGNFYDWIEALDLPVLCAGVGAQAADKKEVILPPDNQRVWAAIAARSPSIGVRGAFTAETLHRNGIHNVEVVGCPTLFRACNRDLVLNHKATGPDRVSFSIRREVGPMYSPDPGLFQLKQKEVIAKLSRTTDLYLSCHGEPEEKAFFFRAPLKMQWATQKLTAENWFDPIYGEMLKRLYESRLYYVGAPGDYDVYVKQFDAALGYRVHAVLPAMAMGVPGVLFAYDTRSAELAETFDLPIFTPDEFNRTPLRDVFDPSRFDLFQNNFARRYDIMKNFIEKFGVKSNM